MTRRSSSSGNYLQILQQSPLFGVIDETSLQHMVQQFQPESWNPGETWQTGRARQRFCLVTEGRLELTCTHPQTGRSATLSLLQPGDGFDVLNLFDGRRHDLAPVALTAVELLSIPAPVMQHWIEIYPHFNRAFCLYLSGELRTLQEFVTDLVFHDTTTRLGKLILRYAIPTTQVTDATPSAPLTINDLSQEAMARMIGSTRVVVNRDLNRLKKRGYISTQRGQLHVHDLEGLRTYCQGLEAE